jgi:hypothetical protein
VILLWAILLGAVGLVGGFLAPLAIAPEANQGPLVGLLITGPAGLVLGAALGAIASALRLPEPANRKILIVAMTAVAIGTIAFCIPPSRHVADLVEGEIVSCIDAETHKSATLARLNDMELSKPLKRNSKWGDDFDKALLDRPGVVVNIHVVRARAVDEGRARWNFGSPSLREWTAVDATPNYFVARSGDECGAFPVGSKAILAVKGNLGAWPPYGIAEMLGMKLAQPLSAEYANLAKD